MGVSELVIKVSNRAAVLNLIVLTSKCYAIVHVFYYLRFVVNVVRVHWFSLRIQRGGVVIIWSVHCCPLSESSRVPQNEIAIDQIRFRRRPINGLVRYNELVYCCYFPSTNSAH